MVAFALVAALSVTATPEAELSAHGIHLRCFTQPCPDNAPRALDAFAAGLARLPEQLRMPPSPVTLVLHAAAREFGMGDGTARAPEWRDDEFHVYAVAPTEERRAQWRVESLSEREHERLWWERALVHAVMKRWDDRLRLSTRASWRRLSGWSANVLGESPRNVFPGAYSRERGMRSAQLDLLTFAEEFFIPAEEGLAVDDRIACQEFSKARVLQDALYDAGLMPVAWSRPRCPSFEGWAQLDTLDHLEVLLVASSGQRPESLFGHLLLRPVHRETELVRGPSFDQAIQLAAITDGVDAGPMYLVRGIGGGYRITVMTLSFRDFEREALDDEQRTIRRFKLNLTREEAAHVMERTYELERRGYFDYRFFSQNCATEAALLVESALPGDEEVRFPGSFVVSPSSALDSLASVRRVQASGVEGALLEPLPGELEPSSVIAARAVKERDSVVTELINASADTERERLAVLFSAAASEDLTTRRAALEQLSALRGLRLPDDPWQRFWLLTVRIERFHVDVARKTLRKLSLATLLRVGPGITTDEQLAARQRVFERESTLSGAQTELDRADALQQRLQHAPRRPLTGKERAEQLAAEAEVRLFAEVTQLQAEQLDRSAASRTDPSTALELEHAELARAEATREERALTRSGTWRTAVGVALSPGAGAPWYRVESAAMRELIGDQRQRGLQAGTEVRVLDLETTISPGHPLPEVEQSRLTLFAWRSLARPPKELRRSFLDAFGYGFNLGSDHLRGREWPDRATLDGDAYAVLDASSNFERHLALGLGLHGEAGFNDHAFAAGGGPRVTVLQRVPLGGHSANALRLEASWLPRFLYGSAELLSHEVKLGVEADFRIAAFNGSALLRPRLSLSFEPGAVPVRTGVLSLVVEPLGFD